MLFVTCRNFKDNQFDLDDSSASNQVYFCERTGINTYDELGSIPFLNKLKESTSKQILIYIHGFSNLPEEHIFKRTEELQSLCDEQERGLIQVVPLIWPCDNDKGIIVDYWDDQKAADQSAFAVARVLEKFMKWQENNPTQCFKRINVLAHSMGNRVLRETFRIWNKYDLAKGVPSLFKNIFMVAADVVNESLEKGESGHYICDAGGTVLVYYASDDLALRSSKISNGIGHRIASRRLGHTGPEDMDKVPNNVFTIDCSDFNNSYDYPKGHSYFLRDNKGKAGKVFNHIFKTIRTGRVPIINKGIL